MGICPCCGNTIDQKKMEKEKLIETIVKLLDPTGEYQIISDILGVEAPFTFSEKTIAECIFDLLKEAGFTASFQLNPNHKNFF